MQKKLTFISQDNYIENEIQSKPIRSPSMRLRFGRRSDPMMPILFEVKFKNFIICTVDLIFPL